MRVFSTDLYFQEFKMADIKPSAYTVAEYISY